MSGFEIYLPTYWIQNLTPTQQTLTQLVEKVIWPKSYKNVDCENDQYFSMGNSFEVLIEVSLS